MNRIARRLAAGLLLGMGLATSTSALAADASDSNADRVTSTTPGSGPLRNPLALRLTEPELATPKLAAGVGLHTPPTFLLQPSTIRPDGAAEADPSAPRRGPYTRWSPAAAHIAVHTGGALALTGTTAAILIAFDLGYMGDAGLAPTLGIAVGGLAGGGLLAAAPYLHRPGLIAPALVGAGILVPAGVTALVLLHSEDTFWGGLSVMMLTFPVAGAAFLTQVVVSEAHLPWRVSPMLGKDTVGVQISGKF